MRHLALFAKHWRPGQAKTRLAAEVGLERAAQIYRACLETTLQRLAAFGDRREVVFTPDDAAADFRQLAPATWHLTPQGDGDLGQRLAAHLQDAIQRGASGVVILGADSPTIPTQFIHAAWEELERQPVVLGPAEDGGYYLLAARMTELPIFADLPWGTSGVFDETVRRLSAAKIGCHCLPRWYDVDDGPGLARLQAELRQFPQGDTQWALLRAALD